MINYQTLLLFASIELPDGSLAFCCAPEYSHPTITFYPYVSDPGLLNLDLFDASKLSGPSRYSYGEIVLANQKDVTTLEGPADWLKTQPVLGSVIDFVGAVVSIYIGPATSVYPTGYTLLATAQVENVTTEWDRYRFTLRGRQWQLDTPINTAVFAGTGGIEGGDELKDTLKPLLIGRCYNMRPILCDSTKLIYAVSPTSGLSVSAMGSDLHVYDMGVELGFAGLKTLADLQTDDPPHGQYYAAVEGYIRLGSTPAGTVTVDGASNGHAFTATPATLVDYLLTLSGHKVGDAYWGAMVDASSYSGLTDTWERGLYLDGSQPVFISRIIDQLVAPLGFWYFSAGGKIRLADLAGAYDGVSAYTVDSTSNIKAITFERSKDTPGGVYCNEVRMSYKYNQYPMDDIAASVSADRKDFLKSEKRTDRIYADPFDIGINLQKVDKVILDSCLTATDDTIMADLYEIFGGEWEIITVTLIRDSYLTAMTLLPGQVVTLDLDGRWDITAKTTIIVGITINQVAETVTLRLRG